MSDFGIRFFLCNLLFCLIIGIFFTTKRILKNHLTSRMQFNLWFLLLGLLAVPLMPFCPAGFMPPFSWSGVFGNTTPSNADHIKEFVTDMSLPSAIQQVNDFTLSVSSKTPSVIGEILCGIWGIGVLVMLLFVIRSKSRLRAVKKSALPLQNHAVRMVYQNCLNELEIKRSIPVYSTAFLKSPMITGLFRPCIYLPIHLISDFHMTDERRKEAPVKDSPAHADEQNFPAHDEEHKEIPGNRFHAADMRYILLHELQHYRYKDAFVNLFMNLFRVLYWFNPLVWIALKEMRNDREIACDASVLQLLKPDDYEDYGNTLINFAEKISLTPLPFATGISGTMKQMQRRIRNISSYEKPSVYKKFKGFFIFCVIAAILLGTVPMLSTHAEEQTYDKWDVSPEKIDLLDLSAYFHGYEGSFVLYDLKNDTWSIYDMDHAALRISPDSTYKIYGALFGLEEGIITPEDSFMAWNKVNWPLEAWNADQDLDSAMRASVNWYFQEIDRQLDASALRNYMKRTEYGNENINSGISSLLPDGIGRRPEDASSFWMEGTLKISPIEQVELLTALYSNRFGFSPENVAAVKDSICLFSSENNSFYGKTGTGRVDGQDVNGWFTGYIETSGNTCFFAANIQSEEHATGSKASEISLAILSDMGIWRQSLR